MLTFQQIILKLSRNKGARPLVIPHSSQKVGLELLRC
jgi:hypothetical protein